MKKFAKIAAVALVAIMALAVLVACGYPSDPDKTASKLEKQGYSQIKTRVASYNALIKAELDGEAVLLGLKAGDIVAVISGVKSDDGKYESISITYCKDADVAKTLYEKSQDSVDQSKEMLEGMGYENINVKISRSGSQVISKSTYTKAD